MYIRMKCILQLRNKPEVTKMHILQIFKSRFIMQLKKLDVNCLEKKNYSSLQNIKYQNITRHESLFFSLQNNNKNRKGRKGRSVEIRSHS